MARPVDLALYERVKASAKRKFRSWPSARGSQWLVAEYQKRGGKFRGKRNGNLQRWNSEAWLNLCAPGLPRCGGKGTQVCRPSRRISSKTPMPLAKDVPSSQQRRLCAAKARNPKKRLSFR